MQAYYDTFCGLLPCRLISISNPGNMPETAPANTAVRCVIEITQNKKPYKKGERVTTCSLHVVPKDKVNRRDTESTLSPYTIGDLMKLLPAKKGKTGI